MKIFFFFFLKEIRNTFIFSLKKKTSIYLFIYYYYYYFSILIAPPLSELVRKMEITGRSNTCDNMQRMDSTINKTHKHTPFSSTVLRRNKYCALFKNLYKKKRIERTRHRQETCLITLHKIRVDYSSVTTKVVGGFFFFFFFFLSK